MGKIPFSRKRPPGALWPRNGSGGNGLVPLVCLTKGRASFGVMANLEAIFQHNSLIPLLKFVSCAKRGPSLRSPHLKPAPSHPQSITLSSVKQRQTQALGLFLPTPMMYRATQVCKHPSPPFQAAPCSLPAHPAPGHMMVWEHHLEDRVHREREQDPPHACSIPHGGKGSSSAARSPRRSVLLPLTSHSRNALCEFGPDAAF